MTEHRLYYHNSKGFGTFWDRKSCRSSVIKSRTLRDPFQVSQVFSRYVHKCISKLVGLYIYTFTYIHIHIHIQMCTEMYKLSFVCSSLYSESLYVFQHFVTHSFPFFVSTRGYRRRRGGSLGAVGGLLNQSKASGALSGDAGTVSHA